MTEFDLTEYLSRCSQKIEDSLKQFLPDSFTSPQLLREAMEYSLMAGGKRLRPSLSIATCEALGGSVENVLPAACAIEMIHTYSLIHDDLPSMDDDDYRRGKLTNHKVFGEANAILAGDALMAEAFALLSDRSKTSLSTDVMIEIMHTISSASGASGMVGGQILDLQGEGANLTLAELERVHRYKTGALISASVAVGGMVAGASKAEMIALKTYSDSIGLAFQIADDLLDVLGNTDELGKPAGSDVEKNKTTYPSVIGVDESKRQAHHLVERAIDALAEFSEAANPLRLIARHIIDRKN